MSFASMLSGLITSKVRLLSPEASPLPHTAFPPRDE